MTHIGAHSVHSMLIFVTFFVFHVSFFQEIQKKTSDGNPADLLMEFSCSTIRKSVTDFLQLFKKNKKNLLHIFGMSNYCGLNFE